MPDRRSISISVSQAWLTGSTGCPSRQMFPNGWTLMSGRLIGCRRGFWRTKKT